MMLPNLYLTAGPDTATVQLLSDSARDALYQGVRIAIKRASEVSVHRVYRDVFKHEAVHVWACDPTSLEWVAEHYEGPNAERAKYLAACLLLGEPINPDSTEPDGGMSVESPPRAPIAPTPAGVPTHA
jgi:hypothetical protein